jgi:predicted  nucleic acid-binding Zn-ribbon protein
MATYYSGDPGALQRLVDELVSESSRKPPGPDAMGPNSTLGIVLNGTTVDFMIPGGPAHEEEVLEPRDTIIEVDGVAVDHNTVNQALKGSDEVGSMVRLGVRKAEDGKRVDLVLKRTSLTYIHHMQVYLELMDQLKGACKRTPDLVELVRRLASKVKEMDAYHAGIENELRKSVRKFKAAMPQIADHIRGAQNGGAGSSADAQRVIDRLQHQLQLAEDNQQRLKQQLDSVTRMSGSGGRGDIYDSANVSQEVQRLQVLLSDAEKDKSSLQFRADKMSKEVSKLRQQLQEGGPGTPSVNSRLSEIRYVLSTAGMIGCILFELLFR